MDKKTNFLRCTFLAVVAVTANAATPRPSLAAGSWQDKPFDEVQGLAQQGDARAERELCVRYAKALGVDQNIVEAYRWCRQAAEQGDPVAMRNVGLAYYDGDAVKKDDKQAFAWFTKAADKGDARAQYNLALCYAEGQGVERDHAKAITWYRRAANQGVSKAQRNLALMLAQGQGTAEDPVEAYKWFELASRADEPQAAEDRDRLAKKISSAQIAAAKQAANAWSPKYEMDDSE